MKTLLAAINKFEDRTSKLLAELRTSIGQMSIEEKEIQADLSDCSTRISTYKDELARAEIRFRQLNDQRQLFRHQAELEEKEKNLRELEEKTHGLK